MTSSVAQTPVVQLSFSRAASQVTAPEKNKGAAN
jgi:hypothetical protein